MDAELVENVYEILLDQVEDAIGHTTTYGPSLDRLCRKLFGPRFAGVYARDTLPKKLAPTSAWDPLRFAIVNLDESHQPGSHWVAICQLPHGRRIVYDSFGRHPSIILPGEAGLMSTESDAEQVPAETNCGARCVTWLLIADIFGPWASLSI